MMYGEKEELGPFGLLDGLWETWTTPVLYALIEAGVIDALHGGPKTPTELARMTSTHPGTLSRMTRSLAPMGIFHEEYPQDGEKEIGLGEKGAFFLSDSPRSLAPIVRFLASPWHWRIWEKTLECLKDGEPGFEKQYGKSVFEYLSQNPKMAKTFDEAMASFSEILNPVYLKHFDFARFSHLVDVGGGYGNLLMAILQKYPHHRGTLFEMEHVIEDSHPLRAKFDPPRLKVQSGDFFTSALPKADAYLLKSILHDWSDDKALEILKNIQKAMPSHARILVLERIIPEDNAFFDAKLTDIEMLMCTPRGKERTKKEFEALFHQAGLQMEKVHSTPLSRVVIELSKRST